MATIMNDKERLPVPLQMLRQPGPMGALTPEQQRLATMITTGPDGVQRLITVPQGGGQVPTPRSKWWLWGSLIVLGIGAAGLVGWWYKKKYMDKGKGRKALPPPRQENRRSPGGSSGVPAFVRGSRKANRKRTSRKKAAPKAKKGSNAAKGRVPSSQYRLDEAMNVQTLIFPKADFTEAAATAWAKKHGYATDKVDETKSSYRIRQKQPGRMGPKTFRTIAFGDSGIKAVVAKGKQYKEAA